MLPEYCDSRTAKEKADIPILAQSQVDLLQSLIDRACCSLLASCSVANDL